MLFFLKLMDDLVRKKRNCISEMCPFSMVSDLKTLKSGSCLLMNS